MLQKFCVLCCGIVLWSLGLCCVPGKAVAQSTVELENGVSDGQTMVREIFGRLPLTIFENTPEGLSDEERLELLETGQTSFWKIALESDMNLSLVSLPFEESFVSVRLFPPASQGGQGGMLVAIGTTSTSMCTIEMWREDKNGRVMPEETPQEPPISDFFLPSTRMPADVEPAVLICLGAQGLEAKAIFWNSTGMAYVPVDNVVSYAWTGTNFEKQIRLKARP